MRGAQACLTDDRYADREAGDVGFSPAAAGAVFDILPPLDLGTHMARLLARAVSEEILPRLVLKHRDRPSAATSPSVRPSPRSVVELARSALLADGTVAMRLVQAQLARGVSLDSVCLDLLAPAARRLGALWTQDRCDFALVTIGVGRLTRIHDEIASDAEPPTGLASRRILLSVVPGEQHVFGTTMLAGFFRRAGWAVKTGPFRDENELVSLVRREAFDVIGLSVSCTPRLASLGLLLHRLRRASRHGVRIMLGGPALADQPDAALLLGADAASNDAVEAVAVAGRLTSLFNSDDWAGRN